MSAAVVDKINIAKVKDMHAAAQKETAKYAQPCTGGVYMGVVNVFLGHFCEGDVKVCGDGRMYRCSPGATLAQYGKKPDVCKYHKLQATDKPPKSAPRTIQFEFDVYDFNVASFDKSVEKEFAKHYALIKCKINLKWKECLDAGGDGYFHEYDIADVECDEDVKEKITSLVKTNKYTFEFQILNAHPKMPGLYFAESVGWPSDQLAVLFGGRARHGGLENMELFFAQHKFDTAEWDKMKQIHTALAHVLSKIEYMYNYLSANSGANIDTPATRRFCQEVLDYITEPYIHEVLKRMVLIKREDAEVHISEIRGVCEYVFQREYPFLDTSTWTYADGEFRNPVRVGMPTQLTSEVRILAYDVVSHCIESMGDVSINPIVNSGKINAFSAYSVFEAYVSYAYNDKDTPPEFKNVLEDARQLLANMNRLKTSSNFALKCLRDSCEIAAAKYSEFKMTSHYMLAASRVFITLLLQKDPSTDHEKFGQYTRRVASKLRANEYSAATNISTVEDYDTGNFGFDDDMSWSRSHMDHVKFEYLVLATQLRVLSRMKSERRPKNYFRFAEE